MVDYILWALLLYFIYIAAHAALKLYSSKGDGNLLVIALGPRDVVLEKSVGAQRCGRAQRNMEEALFFFLPLAILLIITGKADGMGLTGALVFVIARAAYLPAYYVGVAGVRTLVWFAGFVGLIMMVLRLLN